mmetsp:Transcript_24848/g.58333  ORF Transcript_24848/g.58333 Transcript_24848/m.58333 type:complete len:200 (+) Transcript_24848:1022-1621(+)
MVLRNNGQRGRREDERNRGACGRQSSLGADPVLFSSEVIRLSIVSAGHEKIILKKQGRCRLPCISGHSIALAAKLHLSRDDQVEAVSLVAFTEKVAAWHIRLGGGLVDDLLVQFGRHVLEERQVPQLRRQEVVFLLRDRGSLPFLQQLPQRRKLRRKRRLARTNGLYAFLPRTFLHDLHLHMGELHQLHSTDLLGRELG